MKSFLIELIKKSPKLLLFLGWLYSLNSIFLIRGRRYNKIDFNSSFLKNTKIIIRGKNNIVKIHTENRLRNCLINIIGNNCIVTIGKHCILANLEIWIEDDKGEISIGGNTTVESGHFAATEGAKISIGENCMFSNRIEIRNGDSHPIYDLQSNSKINVAQNVTVNNNVWLGADVKVLKGANIGSNSIIGTGSIVTGIVDSNCIYVGSPAKKVKSSIYWARHR